MLVGLAQRADGAARRDASADAPVTVADRLRAVVEAKASRLFGSIIRAEGRGTRAEQRDPAIVFPGAGLP